jgi:hypothetical protein
MFNITLVTVVDETADKIPQQTIVALTFAQYPPATVAGEVTTPNLPPLFGFLTLEITSVLLYPPWRIIEAASFL